MTPTINMTPKIWIRLVVDFTIVLSCNIFTILIVNTALER